MQEVEIKPIAPVEPGEVRLIPQTAAELEAAAAAAQAASVPTDFKKGNRAYTEKLYKEEQGLKEIAEAFNMLDVSGSGLKGIGDAKITLDEFKKGITRLQLHDPPGSAPGWKDDAFDRFDVDNSGFVDYNELCFAIGREVMSAKANGVKKTAKDCLQDVIGGLQQTQTAAEAEGKLAADAAVVQVKQTSAEEECECGTYCILTICPCVVLCEGPGAAMGGEKIEGMEKAVEYVSKGKEELPEFRWHIQNYHTERVRKEDGPGYDDVEVTSSTATATGTLSAKDKSEVFVPNTRLRNVALTSHLTVNFEKSFADEYKKELNDFCKRNREDEFQRRSVTYSMPHLNGTDSDGVRIEWVPGKDPWWANNVCKWITCCTCTGVCWYHAMKSFMAAEDYHYVKEATGWHTRPPNAESTYKAEEKPLTTKEKLQRRFPNVAESDIIAALEKHDGHGRDAATDLASRYGIKPDFTKGKEMYCCSLCGISGSEQFVRETMPDLSAEERTRVLEGVDWGEMSWNERRDRILEVGYGRS